MKMKMKKMSKKPILKLSKKCKKKKDYFYKIWCNKLKMPKILKNPAVFKYQKPKLQ